MLKLDILNDVDTIVTIKKRLSHMLDYSEKVIVIDECIFIHLCVPDNI